MLTNTLYRVSCEKGLKLLQKRGEGEAREMTSWRLHLENNERERYSNDGEETILVLQQGAGILSAAGSNWRVSRSSVFTERATALYLPPGVELVVRGEPQIEAILVSTPAKRGTTSPAVVTPADIVVNHRGKETYTREVHDIF